MERQNDTVSLFVLRQGRSVEEGHLEQNDPKCSEEGGGRILVGSLEDRLQQGADKCGQSYSTVEPSLWEGQQIEPVVSPGKWETVASEQWSLSGLGLRIKRHRSLCR